MLQRWSKCLPPPPPSPLSCINHTVNKKTLKASKKLMNINRLPLCYENISTRVSKLMSWKFMFGIQSCLIRKEHTELNGIHAWSIRLVVCHWIYISSSETLKNAIFTKMTFNTYQVEHCQYVLFNWCSSKCSENEKRKSHSCITTYLRFFMCELDDKRVKFQFEIYM